MHDHATHVDQKEVILARADVLLLGPRNTVAGFELEDQLLN